MNKTSTTPASPVPGAHPDDDSVAGEEDPGASLDEALPPTSPQPAPASPPAPPAGP